METYPLESFLTVGDLKKLLANMSDDAVVSARDRDCINLYNVSVVGLDAAKRHEIGRVRFVDTIDEVYGGREHHLENESKQAIIFCEND